MSRARISGSVVLAALAVLGSAQLARADGCCSHWLCCHWFVHYSEGCPRLCFKCVCPKPICDPCDLPHAGYWQTCWQPWPYPPDWSHCHAPQPTEMVPWPPPPGVRGATETPATSPYGPKLPAPRSLDRPPKAAELPPAGEGLTAAKSAAAPAVAAALGRPTTFASENTTTASQTSALVEVGPPVPPPALSAPIQESR